MPEGPYKMELPVCTCFYLFSSLSSAVPLEMLGSPNSWLFLFVGLIRRSLRSWVMLEQSGLAEGQLFHLALGRSMCGKGGLYSGLLDLNLLSLGGLWQSLQVQVHLIDLIPVLQNA